MSSEDLWIWHYFFCGLAEIIFFARPASGDALACNYIVNGHNYTMGVLSS